MITYGSACSGIESASLAWEPLGWQAQWFAEIEPFPSAVIAHRWPHVPNLGDMTQIASKVLWGRVNAPDVLVAGTPCQAFSVAGLREGLSDDRGQLTLSYMRLCDANDHIRQRSGKPPCIIVWENVPGVLSSKDNAFGCFLAGLAGEDAEIYPGEKPEPGKSNKHFRWNKQSGEHIAKWPLAGCVIGPKRAIAWRTLDAQYFGVAQRRRRVFVVASARNGFDPAEILFEPEGMRRDTPPSREAREDITYKTENCLRSSGVGVETIGDTRGADPAVAVRGYRMAAFGEYADDETASTMKALDYKDATDLVTTVHGTQDPCVADNTAFSLGRNNGAENAVLAVSLRGRDGGATAEIGGTASPALRASQGGGCKPHVLAVHENQRSELRLSEVHGALNTQGGKPGQGYPAVLGFNPVQEGMGLSGISPPLGASQGGGNQGAVLTDRVRRLTPIECERLQGMPDNHTQIPWRGKPASECPDGPRYKAIGNSKAVPVIRWIGERLANQLQALDSAA